jgi:hypothetical protein
MPNEVLLLTQLDAYVLSFPTAIARFLLAVPKYTLPTVVFAGNLSQPLLQLFNMTSYMPLQHRASSCMSEFIRQPAGSLSLLRPTMRQFLGVVAAAVLNVVVTTTNVVKFFRCVLTISLKHRLHVPFQS